MYFGEKFVKNNAKILLINFELHKLVHKHNPSYCYYSVSKSPLDCVHRERPPLTLIIGKFSFGIAHCAHASDTSPRT